MEAFNIILQSITVCDIDDKILISRRVDKNENTEFEDKIYFNNFEHEADITNGKLRGLLDTRDETIDKYLGDLNKLAEGLAERFNEVHRNGFDADGNAGQDFFEIVDSENASGTIKLTDVVSNDTNMIAAGTQPNPGNGENAMALSDVIKKEKVIDGDVTVAGFYQSVIARLGVEGQRAEQMVSNQDVLVNQLQNQQDSIAGVSLDEEMANMIKFQQAYNAAAKIISNTNKVLDNLMQVVR